MQAVPSAGAALLISEESSRIFRVFAQYSFLWRRLVKPQTAGNAHSINF